jgi:formyltetrahydrofolate deformylase
MKEFATITVIGGDKTGVIARITNFLFEQHANIEALEEQVTRGRFSMTLQASWPLKCPDRQSLILGLEGLGRQLDMEIKARFSEQQRRLRMAMFVTKEPHCAEALVAELKSGRLKADPAVMIGNYPALKPLARQADIPFETIPWEDRSTAEKKAMAILEEYEVDFIVLARFMKILSPNFVWHYKNKIINIHPSLLPSFPGPQPYRQAYEHGVKIAGVTAHFVSMHLDEGPIIAQASMPIHSHATLKSIVTAGQKLEAKVLVKAVKLFIAKRLDVYWGVVKEV